MSFTNFVDPRQVFLNNNNEPNTFGRLSFYEIGTITPKHIFTDVNLTTSAENPQYINAAGRLDNQIFLGYGDYSVNNEQFIGTGDPTIAPPEDFVSLYWAYASGQPVATSGSNTSFQVDTIAELRSITTPLDYPTVIVTSYNTFGDLYPRTYFWDSTSLDSDDYGSTIKCTSVATGRYKKTFTNVIDVREFGIFDGQDSTKNSQLNALIAYVNFNADTKSIYFPQGTYHFAGGSFAFNQKIILDDGAHFSTTSGNQLTLNVNSDFEIRYSSSGIVTKSGFTNTPIEMEYVTVNFDQYNTTLNKELKASWFGLILNEADTTDAFSIQQFLSQPAIYTKVIDQDINYESLTGISVSGDVVFDGGSIQNGSGTITFNGSKISQKSSGAFLGTGSLNRYVFKDCIIDSRTLQNNGTTLDTFQAKTETSGSIIEFNDDFTFTTDFTDSTKFRYKHINGLIYANDSGQTVTFDSLDRADSYIFAGSSNVSTKDRTVISNYLPTSATEAQESVAFRYALKNAFKGSGILDLQNRSLTVSAASVIDLVEGAGFNLGLKNGTLNLVGSINVIQIDDDITQLTLENLSILSDGVSTQTLIKVESPETVTILNIKNVTTSMTTTSSIVSTESGGNIIACNISDSFIVAGVAINDPTGEITELSISDSEVYGDIVHKGPGIHDNFNNSRFFKGNSGTIQVNGHEQTVIDGCALDGVQIFVYPEDSASNYYASKISDCSFQSTSANPSLVVYLNDKEDTKFIGSSVSDCSFVGVNSNEYATVIVMNDTGGSYSSAYDHKIMITDNNKTIDSYYNTTTKGSFVGESYVFAVDVSNDNQAEFRMYTSANPGLLVIPGTIPACNFLTASIISSGGGTGYSSLIGGLHLKENNLSTTTYIPFLMRNWITAGLWIAGATNPTMYTIELYS